MTNNLFSESDIKELIALRRHFHQNPEVSFNEKETAKKIVEFLTENKIEFTELKNYAVVATIKGKGSKKIALRGDTDALPVQEEAPVEYASKKPGVMHSCGHDGHTAMLMMAAKYLNNNKDKLDSTVFCCFQPAEEAGGGAEQVLEFLDSKGGVSDVLGIHLWAEIPTGKISVDEGHRMANGDRITIKITGRGGHGSRPDLSINPILPAADIIMRITSIPVNRYSPLDPIVISIGQINSGTMGNIIPNEAVIIGGYRSFSEKARHKVKELIEEISHSVAKSYGAIADVNIEFGVPCVFNHKESSDRAKVVIEKNFGADYLYDFEKLCASENFGFYTEKYKGLMAFVGAGNSKKFEVFAHHHPKFQIDEDALPIGANLYVHYALNYK